MFPCDNFLPSRGRVSKPDLMLKILSWLTALWLCSDDSTLEGILGQTESQNAEELMLSNCDTGEDSW